MLGQEQPPIRDGDPSVAESGQRDAIERHVCQGKHLLALLEAERKDANEFVRNVILEDEHVGKRKGRDFR
ncbi:hypothetical protein DEJ31_08945 [Curtobacterium sp. MCPF17_031]|nr:hypothetical protein DEJ31_08945 [Curtobacterium sp. MCPF17_031]